MCFYTAQRKGSAAGTQEYFFKQGFCSPSLGEFGILALCDGTKRSQSHRQSALPEGFALQLPTPCSLPCASHRQPLPPDRRRFGSTHLALVHIHLQERCLRVFVTQRIEGGRDPQARAAPVEKMTLPLNSTFLLFFNACPKENQNTPAPPDILV